MSIQITSIQSLPQGKRLMHVEKSGPAFETIYYYAVESAARRAAVAAQGANETEFLPLPIAEQLGASLVAQTTAAIGDVLSAINRGVLLDLMPAWQRLLKVQMLSLPVPPIDVAMIRQRWAYADLRDAVDAALSSQVGPWAWVRPDMMIRQMAREAAERSEQTLMGLTRDWLLAGEFEATTKETLRQSMVTVTNNIAAYKAFGEGK